MFVRKITIFRTKDFSEEYREQLLEYAYNLYLQNGANSLNYIVTTLQDTCVELCRICYNVSIHSAIFV